jgi:hypothetical protein
MVPNHSVRQSIGWNLDMKDALESLNRDRHSDISGVSEYALDLEIF